MDSFFIFGAEYLYILAPFVALVFFLKQPREVKMKILVLGVIALPLAYLVSLLAGALYYNPLPFVVEGFAPLIPREAENGFPSHHTLLVAAIAAVVSFYNKKVGALLWFITILVGVSRVYVGVHHWIDVIASVVIALAVGWGVHTILQKKNTPEA